MTRREMAEAQYRRNRRVVLRAANHLCVKCGEKADEVHHVYGREVGDVEKLRPLCQPCHRLLAPNGDEYWEWERTGKSARQFIEDGVLALIEAKGLDISQEARREAAAQIATTLLKMMPRTSDLTVAGMARAVAAGKTLGRRSQKAKETHEAEMEFLMERVRYMRSVGLHVREIAGALSINLNTVQRMCATKVA